jgi:transposase
MRVETVLNHVSPFKRFVFADCRWGNDGPETALELTIHPRKNGLAVASCCGRVSPLYDASPEERVFHFIPLWNIPVRFRYRMRRVTCPVHGVHVERVPWAEGKEHLTKAAQLFLARWARHLSWKGTAEAFGFSWDDVFRSIKAVVAWGLKHRSLEGIRSIGVDELLAHKGYKFVTLVYQLDEGCRRLLYVGPKRKVRSLLGFFRMLGKERCEALRFICSDMWKPYIKVIRKKAPHALHILDRFHIVANLNKAVDKVRAAEAKALAVAGFGQPLAHLKYCFLKKVENLTGIQEARLAEVLRVDYKSVRAYLLKESFQGLWNYSSVHWAQWYLRQWCARAMRSRLTPVKKFARSVRKFELEILNWFRARKAFSSGIVEGFNRKANLVTRKSYGFRTDNAHKIALYHNLGQLPEPPWATHRFC